MFWHLSSLNTTKMFDEIFSLYEMCHKSILDLSELFPAIDNIKLAGNLSLSINNNNLWKKKKQFSLDIWSHHKCWYELILSTARRLLEVYKFVVRTHELIAQRGGNSSCEYFYRSLGCPQLMSSSCDIRVHFRVARQLCYFKCKCKCCGKLSCFFQKCVLRRPFLWKPCFSQKSVYTLEFMLHWGKPTMN